MPLLLVHPNSWTLLVQRQHLCVSLMLLLLLLQQLQLQLLGPARTPVVVVTAAFSSGGASSSTSRTPLLLLLSPSSPRPTTWQRCRHSSSYRGTTPTTPTTTTTTTTTTTRRSSRRRLQQRDLDNSENGNIDADASTSTTRTSTTTTSPRHRQEEDDDDDDNNESVVCLQDPHFRPTPATKLRQLAEYCDAHGINEWDFYGDFDKDTESSSASFLRSLEQTIADDLGKDDAVFMPSGVMAQSIALLVHQEQRRRGRRKQQQQQQQQRPAPTANGANGSSSSSSSSSNNNNTPDVNGDATMAAPASTTNNNSNSINSSVGVNANGGRFKNDRFICHETSHLLLHEQEAYAALLNLRPIVVPSTRSTATSSANAAVTATVDTNSNDDNNNNNNNNQNQNQNRPDMYAWFEQHRTPLTFRGVLQTLDQLQMSESLIASSVVACIVELPHRELGGRLPDYQKDLVRLQEWCTTRNIALHCDGARLYEATAAFGEMGSQNAKTPADLAALFDSVYISCYKGWGSGLPGALLVGDQDFCNQARIWLRRFGGNLYTMMPNVVAAAQGYQLNWKDTLPLPSPATEASPKDDKDGQGQETTTSHAESNTLSSPTEDDNSDNNPSANNNNDGRHLRRMSFVDLRNKLRTLVERLSAPDMITTQLVTFDPPIPVTNMVHGYLRCTAAEGLEWSRWITEETGVQVLRRIVDLDASSSFAYEAGFRSKFEWTMGPANGQVVDEVYYEGWKALAETYLANQEAIFNGEKPIEYSSSEDDRNDDMDPNNVNEESDDNEEEVNGRGGEQQNVNVN